MKFVVRLLDADDQIVAWAVVTGAPGPGGIFAAGPTLFTIEQAGQPKRISIEWTDTNAARVTDLIELVEVTPEMIGRQLRLDWLQPLWTIADDPAAPRPPVTVREAVTVAPAPALLGAVGHA